MNGAPAKPMSGTRSPSAARARRTVSKTKGTVSAGSTLGEPLDVGRRAHRAVDDGALAPRELEADAERLHHEQDVGEEDGRVHAELLDRQHRHLGRRVRRPAELEEPEPLADRAVLGQEAAGLAHEPDRREGRRAAAAGGEECVHGWDWPPLEACSSALLTSATRWAAAGRAMIASPPLAMTAAPVASWMSSPVHTVAPETLAADAVALLRRHAIRHLPVLEGDAGRRRGHRPRPPRHGRGRAHPDHHEPAGDGRDAAHRDRSRGAPAVRSTHRLPAGRRRTDGLVGHPHADGRRGRPGGGRAAAGRAAGRPRSAVEFRPTRWRSPSRRSARCGPEVARLVSATREPFAAGQRPERVRLQIETRRCRACSRRSARGARRASEAPLKTEAEQHAGGGRRPGGRDRAGGRRPRARRGAGGLRGRARARARPGASRRRPVEPPRD